VVIDAAGKPASINAAIASARHAGRIVIVGIPSQAETSIHLWEAGHRELTITVQKRSNGNDHDALQLLMSGKIDPASFISHRFPMERGADAFKTMGAYADGVIKPVVEF
jgi:L-iditol 2-dehydrogenase